MGDLFAPWHLIVLGLVFILLFGSRRLPDAARSLGKSLRIFKAETKALREDEPADQSRPIQAVVQQSPGEQATVQQPTAQQQIDQLQQQIRDLQAAADQGTATNAAMAEAQRTQQPG